MRSQESGGVSQVHLGPPAQSRALACRAAALVGALALVFTAPTLAEMRVTECVELDGSRVETVEPTELRKNAAYNVVYRVAAFLLLTSLGPFLLIAALSISIIVSVGVAT